VSVFVLFGVQERPVGGKDQVMGALPVLGIGRDPDGDREGESVARQLAEPCFDLPFDPGDEKIIGLFQPRFRQDDDDLIAAIPGSDIGGANGLPDRLPEHRQRFIPRLMTVPVVELLEIIDINERQRELPAVTLGPLELPVEQVIEATAVEQSGEAVGNCQLLDAGMGPRVLDGDRCKGGEDLDLLEVRLGELAGREIVNVEDPDGLPLVNERDADE